MIAMNDELRNSPSSPTMSNRLPRLRCDGAIRNASRTVTPTSGRLIRKMPRQLQYWVRTPPIIGPAAAASPFTAPQIPIAIPRSRPS
jgi:hypothetical protein